MTMIVDILTLLPQVFDKVFDESILGAARQNGLIEIRIHNLREFGEGRHKTLDDAPFGGGPGMVLKPDPLARAVAQLRSQTPAAPVIGLTPQGTTLTQGILKELVRFPRLVIVCGRYEGFDDRILPGFDAELSLGDYVISGGEFAAMVLVDGLSRLIPGTVGRMESVEQDSFFHGWLDHPQYTRPAVWQDREVPAPLMAGNHRHIETWRRNTAMIRTAVRRPDLLFGLPMTHEEGEAFQDAVRSADAVW
jgi:tRNA (guanine37-N1)-methyltransferase